MAPPGAKIVEKSWFHSLPAPAHRKNYGKHVYDVKLDDVDTNPDKTHEKTTENMPKHWFFV